MNSADHSQLSFPCRFPIKAIGKASEDLVTLITQMVGRHVPDLAQDAIEVRPSRNQNYLSVTISFEASSRQQLDAIYRELTASEHILLVL